MAFTVFLEAAATFAATASLLRFFDFQFASDVPVNFFFLLIVTVLAAAKTGLTDQAHFKAVTVVFFALGVAAVAALAVVV